jgi:hypothetical protein
MEPTLQAAEIRRSSERPTSDLTAYDWYLRALPHQFSVLIVPSTRARKKQREDFYDVSEDGSPVDDARILVRRTIPLDPGEENRLQSKLCSAAIVLQH